MQRETIEQAIRQYPQEGELPCAVAHYIAVLCEVAPEEVGATADRLGVRITQCQLGLFGYARKGTPEYRIVRPAEEVPTEVAEALREAVQGGRLPCALAWEIAERFGLSRHQIGNMAEALGLKVAPCQLGCF